MDFFTALDISASGLSAERTRVNAATSNLANAESTRGPDGGPYRRIDPVLQTAPFEATLAGAAGGAAPAGVQVSELVADPTPGRRVYSPGHPDADAEGFVTLPNVDPIHEVVNLMSASKAYEANATAVETLKTMSQRALDITR
ncbi:MAG TPA: flagellar basal body rod protein FlgC [Myxococcaceae bacterium]|nr:flagellar basal body rod protein FlgC [Myxococcaceae bacterium]